MSSDSSERGRDGDRPDISPYALIALVAACVMIMVYGLLRKDDVTTTVVTEYQPITDLQVMRVTVTTYQPTILQTDEDPSVTADGTKIDLEGGRWVDRRIVALSRDMLARFGGSISWGERIWVDLPAEPELSGWWIVHDTMAERWTKRIDLMVPKKFNNRWDNITVIRPVADLEGD